MYTRKQRRNAVRNLRYLRMRNGLTVKELSETVGCYKDHSEISPDRLKAYCDFFNVDEEMILMEHSLFVKKIWS